MMRRTFKNLSMAAVLLTGLAALAQADRAGREGPTPLARGALAGGAEGVDAGALEVAMSPPRVPQARAAQPRFVYASGAQGVGYYAAPGPRSAATARTQTTGSRRSVGPGVRDWTTGQRTSMHRPWLRPRR